MLQKIKWLIYDWIQSVVGIDWYFIFGQNNSIDCVKNMYSLHLTELKKC